MVAACFCSSRVVAAADCCMLATVWSKRVCSCCRPDSSHSSRCCHTCQVHQSAQRCEQAKQAEDCPQQRADKQGSQMLLPSLLGCS